ncbi:hypothetical protein L596_000409 [Steinernema carpocapsae]|uniref:Uncharacterized protein n=1 Tax=Steinernema carpocapsae TaxID=34508 RepID=A0A4U8UHY8_STECR|nr:hypothetical protein L596_000409 [Steinernema carpocapsae]
MACFQGSPYLSASKDLQADVRDACCGTVCSLEKVRSMSCCTKYGSPCDTQCYKNFERSGLRRSHTANAKSEEEQ